MVAVQEINLFLDELDSVIESLYIDEKTGMEEFEKIVPKIQLIMGEFIQIVPALIEAGIDIPVDTLVGQIARLEEVIKNHDTVGIIDSLRYEIGDSVSIYKEIIVAMGEE